MRVRGDADGLISDDCLLPELLGRLLKRLLGREPAAERGVITERSESAVDGRERGNAVLSKAPLASRPRFRTRLNELFGRFVAELRNCPVFKRPSWTRRV